MTKAVWVEGARSNGVNAQVAYERLEVIREQCGGLLKADGILADAAAEASPLHPFFEWDDSVAAREHRLEQARLLVRSIRVVIQSNGKAAPMRAYVHIDRPDINAYMTTASVMSDLDLSQMTLAKAKADLRSWRDRYQELQVLAEIKPVFEAIEAVVEEPVPA